MEETEKIWMDGRLVDWKDAKVHVLTHTLHYGMGVFEGIRFYNTVKGTAVFRMDEHINRLYRGAEECFMEVPYSKEGFGKAIIDTIKANSMKEGYVRPIIFYGYGKMGVSPKGAPVNCAIAVWPWGKYLGEDAVKIKTSSYMRMHPKSTHADLKICGNYVNSILACVECRSAGYDEAILLDCDGNVAEGPGENIFIVKDGKLHTPPLGNILPGITRMSVMELAKDLGYEVIERPLRLEEVMESDEAFFTGTAAEIIPIAEVNDRKLKNVGTGITKRLHEGFSAIVQGRNEKYLKWLAFVS
jgi:branched-chain amino acid aminotransferase